VLVAAAARIVADEHAPELVKCRVFRAWVFSWKPARG
jgi:hypothetical protein